MPSYLDQIPKQLAARRKAFNAARENPALLPSCWAIVRSVANNMYEYMRNAVIGGCTFPDRPVSLSVDDAAFINFGATQRLLDIDSANMEAEAGGRPPPDPDLAQPSPEAAERVRRRLAGLARMYGLDHPATRVYNLAPWLQDMYRDRLDVDFAEDLQRQIDALGAYMDSVPKSIAATGLSAKLSKGVMDAFKLFKTITGSSHQLDREKMSFVDRRSYVNTIQKIELIMAKADESLGSARAGRSVVREMFGLWKDANYELMGLTRRLRVLWAGTSLDDRIQELSDLLGAVQKTLNRCSEESSTPAPQLPVVRADSPAGPRLSRAEIAQAFLALTFHDPVVGDTPILRVRETRKFGPLAVVIAPGSGQARYCWEIRKLNSGEDEDARRSKDTATVDMKERELDVDRRIRYPLNCLVVPAGSEPDGFPRDLADAWLEYNQHAFPVAYKEFFEAAKNASPAAFLPPEGKGAKDLPATYARRALAGLVADFVRWSQSGALPEGERAAEFAPIRDLVLSRLKPDGFLVPARYRPLVELYAEAGAKRRQEMWRRYLGPRFALDRQLVAVSVLMKDWNGFREHLKLLPLADTRNNANLTNGFAKVKDQGDPFAEHKAVGFFQKFLTEQPDLKTALVAVESQVAIEVETLRAQSESLGRVFQYDQASEAMLRRQASQIQEKRLNANAHIDHYLTGLMYAMDGNLEASEAAFSRCLVPRGKRAADVPPPLEVPEEIDGEWFREHLRPLDGKFEKRRVPGENGAGTVCYDFVQYNMGVVYGQMDRPIEAAMCFKGVLDSDAGEYSHLCRQWAQAHLDKSREGIAAAGC